MAQYRDGETRTKGGVTYVRQNGVWVPQGASPNVIMPAPKEDPKPIFVPGAETPTVYDPKTGSGTPIPGVTPPRRTTWRVMTTREKVAMQLDPSGEYKVNNDGDVQVIRQPKEPSKADLISPAERTSAIQGYKDSFGLEKLAEDLEKKYLAGPGATKGVMGVQDYFGGEANSTFDNTANRSRGLIKRGLGFSSGESNAVQESEATYGPFIPKASNWDGEIEDKIQSLRDLARDAREKSVAILGGTPDANGNITPVQPQQQGRADYSNMSHGGDNFTRTPTPTGSDTRTIKNEEASSYIDSLVRNGLPYSAAARQFRQRFPDVPLFAPKDYNDARRHHKKNPDYQGSYGWSEKKVPMSGLEQGMNAISQSVPGAAVGRYANAAVAGIPGALAGDQGTYALDQMGQTLGGGGSFAADAAGAVTGMFLGNKALKAVGADKAIRGLGELGKNTPGLRGLSSSVIQNPANARFAVNDLGYGATFGATQNPDNPLAGAAIGAASVGAGNLAGRHIVGPALGALGHTRAGQAVGNWAAQRNGGTFSPASKLPRPERMLVSQAGPDFSQISGRLNEASELGLPYSLADADPRLRMLAGSATRKSPDVRALAENVVGSRQQGQAERAIGFIDQNLAPSGDIGAIKTGALNRARSQSAALYERAMKQSPPDDKALLEMLETPVGSKAIREAYDIALNDGRSPGELSFDVVDGQPVLNGLPNWRTLQYAKMGLDSIVEKARDPRTGILNPKDPAARALKDFRTRFVRRLGDLNGDYKKANAAFAAEAQKGSAAEMGYKATTPRMTQETVQGVVSGIPEANLPSYRQGFASSMADTVENSRLVSDPYNAIYGSPAQQAKVGMVFPEGAETFGRARALEGDMSRTAYETLGGSPTAARHQADGAFDAGALGTAAEVAGSMATGMPPLNALSRFGGDAWRMGLGKSGQRKAEEIGPMLLDQDPAAAAALLEDIARRNAEYRRYRQATRGGGGLFGSAMTMPFIANP